MQVLKRAMPPGMLRACCTSASDVWAYGMQVRLSRCTVSITSRRHRWLFFVLSSSPAPSLTLWVAMLMKGPHGILGTFDYGIVTAGDEIAEANIV